MSTAPKPALFPNLRRDVVEGYLRAPDHVNAEILDGELVLSPRPRHALAASRLGMRLRPFGDPTDGDPGGWLILDEPEIHLGPRPDIVDPGLAGWRRQRLPDEPETAFITVVPDWVCEVLSDRTEADDRGRKMRNYRREGVAHYWLLDPRSRTLEVYKLVGGRRQELDTWEGEGRVRAEPFDALDLDLAALWRW